MTLIFRRFCCVAATSAGQRVLDLGLEQASRIFPGRVRAAYALGSLGGGGGFSRAVSDVDFAIILDKLHNLDNERAQLLVRNVKNQVDVELADRLSFFWMSVSEVGRFPPVDRLDLIESGRLLQGNDCRGEIARPTKDEIVMSSARMALEKFNVPSMDLEFANPSALVQAGQRSFTKRVLFPVRFILTAETGRIGRNEAAVQYYLRSPSFPLAAKSLVKSAFECRFVSDYRPEILILLTKTGLLPVYQSFVQVFLRWLHEQLHNSDAFALGLEYNDWQERLETLHHDGKGQAV